MFTLDVRVAIQTLSEVLRLDEDLPVDLKTWLEGLSLLTSAISLPAFREGSKTLRMLLQLATLV